MEKVNHMLERQQWRRTQIQGVFKHLPPSPTRTFYLSLLSPQFSPTQSTPTPHFTLLPFLSLTRPGSFRSFSAGNNPRNYRRDFFPPTRL